MGGRRWGSRGGLIKSRNWSGTDRPTVGAGSAAGRRPRRAARARPARGAAGRGSACPGLGLVTGTRSSFGRTRAPNLPGHFPCAPLPGPGRSPVPAAQRRRDLPAFTSERSRRSPSRLWQAAAFSNSLNFDILPFCASALICSAFLFCSKILFSRHCLRFRLFRFCCFDSVWCFCLFN